ncbi:MAG TPA: DUF6600 domain-containing protein [Bacteroidota bacterium]|nr:DUF6600 domain-containing protein [Bacteroidota bacterium]
MKRLFWVILAIFFAYGASEAHKPRGDRKFAMFYGSLAGQGEWIEMSIGTAWRPHNTGHQWRPYMRGRWIWTDYGWYWNSYEPFGWATYHYGRWIYDDYYGWIWVPDDVWGPAWVEWRYDDDYVGWAPLPPHARFSISVGITFGDHWMAPVHYWNFVPCGNFSSVNIVNYVQPPDVTRRIFGRTRSGGSVRTVDRRIVNDGVGLDRIERRTREKIRKVEIVERGNPGEDRVVRKNNRDRLEVFRPGPDELRKESIAPRSRERDAAGPRTGQPSVRDRDDGRNARRPELKREKPETRRPKPEVNRARPDVSRQKPEVSKARPEIKRPKPEVSRETPSVKRDKPDGRSTRPRQSGKRGRDG